MTMLQRAVLLSLLVMLLASCGSAPEYTPDAATIATREADEYKARTDNAKNLFTALYWFFIAMLALFFGLSLFLSVVAYRRQAAGAALEEVKARRARLVDLGGGAVLELIGDGRDGEGVIHRVQYDAVPQVIPAQPAPTIQQAVTPRHEASGLQAFLIEAAAIVGWDSDTIPSWRRWPEKGFTITAATWMRYTDDLAGRDLIDKSHGRETVILDGALRDVYEAVTPTPPAEQ